MKRIIVIVVLLLSALMLVGQSKKVSPPGEHVGQINMYRVDSFMYDITYFNPNVYTNQEEIYYEIFKRFVANNEAVYIHIWVDQIKEQQEKRNLYDLPDSTMHKIIQYHKSIPR